MQRRGDALLVAARSSCRRSARCRRRRRSAKCARPSSSVCGRRAGGVLPVVGEQQLAAAVGVLGAGRRTRSCRRRARAPPRTTRTCCRARCGRRPCARRAASRRARPLRALTTGTRRTSTSAGCRRPGRGCGSARRSAGTAGRPCRRRRGGVLHAVPRGLLHPRAGGAHDRERLVVADPPVGRHGSTCAREAALALPEVADAGDRALVEQRVADRARRVVRAQARAGTPARRARARGCPGRASPGGGRSACATRSAARAPARRTGRPRPRPCAGRARRGACARRQRWPSRYVPHEPVMRRCEWIARSPSKRRKRCLPCASTRVTARPASFSGQRSPRRRGLGCAISGIGPSTSGRMRRAA